MRSFVGWALDREKNPKATRGVASCNELQVQIHNLGYYCTKCTYEILQVQARKESSAKIKGCEQIFIFTFVCEYIVHGCVSQHLLSLEANSYPYDKKLTTR
jgi:DNA replicative helicase MCM subunit Mcm2 (Cdc46/Mcm family)